MQRFLLLVTFILFSVSLYAQPRPTRERFFTISSTSANFNSDGGTKTFTISSSDEWGISSIHDNWLHLERSEDKLVLSVNRNDESSSRNGLFLLTSGDKKIQVSVTQSGQDILSISSSLLVFGYSGGEKIVIVKANTSWRIESSSSSWRHISIYGNEVKITVEPNETHSLRTDTIKVKAGNKEQSIEVRQEGVTTIKPSVDKLIYTEKGGSYTVSVTSDKVWEIGDVAESERWIRLSRNGNGVRVSIEPNTSTSSRSASFFIKSGNAKKYIEIYQEGATRLMVSSDNLKYAAAGGSRIITVSSDKAWEIGSVTERWIHISRNGNGINVSIDENPNDSNRSAWFTIKSGNSEKRIDIYQSGAPYIRVSNDKLNFNAYAGTQTIVVTSNYDWKNSVGLKDWVHLERNGKNLVVKVDKNPGIYSRRDSVTLSSEGKTILINIQQAGSEPYLKVNGSSEKVSTTFDSYGGLETFSVKTNLDNYRFNGVPDWCMVWGKTSDKFELSCLRNKKGYARYRNMEVIADDKIVQIHIRQEADSRRRRRMNNGGWINMALGCEGGYSVNGDNNWYTNGVVGVRIGNYSDVFQVEVGACPGVIDGFKTPEFHLPVYGSIKLSTSGGKFYMKLGGAYNAIRYEGLEGKYSIRGGFGTAWKHFEWDWAYVQFNSPSEYYGSNRFLDLFDLPNMMVGMRMAWYITR